MIHSLPTSIVPPSAEAACAAAAASSKVIETCVRLFKSESMSVHHAIEFFGYVTRYTKREDGTPFIGIKAVDEPLTHLFETLLPPSIKPSYVGLYFTLNSKTNSCLNFGILEQDDISDLVEDPAFPTEEFSFFNASRYGDVAYLKFTGSLDFPKLTYTAHPQIFLFDTRFLRKDPRIAPRVIPSLFPIDTVRIAESAANNLCIDPFTLADLEVLCHALYVHQALILEMLSRIPYKTIHSLLVAGNFQLLISHLDEGIREIYLNSRKEDAFSRPYFSFKIHPSLETLRIYPTPIKRAHFEFNLLEPILRLAEAIPVPISLPILKFSDQPPKTAEGILPEEIIHIGFAHYSAHLGGRYLDCELSSYAKLYLCIQLLDAICLLEKHQLFHKKLIASNAMFTPDLKLKLTCYGEIDSVIRVPDGKTVMAQNIVDAVNIIMNFYFDGRLPEGPDEIALKALLDSCLDPDMAKRPKPLDLLLNFKEIADRLKS